MIRTSYFARPTTPSQPAIRPQQRRVLVVDADASERSVLDLALKRAGFEPYSVESAVEGERLLNFGRLNPDLVVCATRLNGDDGFSFVAQLRGQPQTARVPVVLLAQPGEDEGDELARVVGADRVLRTPIHVRDVVTLGQILLTPSAEATRVLDGGVVPVAHALRAMLSTGRIGTFEMEGGRAHIAFRAGKVIDAHLDGRHGEEALARALALTAGPYRLVERSFSFDPTFTFSLKDLVQRVMPRLARWESLLLRSVPLGARLSVDFQALAKALPELPDGVNAIVRLFDGQRDVRRVLLDSELDEVTTLEVATRLYSLGVVLPDDSGAETIEVLKVAPRLFEPRPIEAEQSMEALFASAVPVLVEPAQPPAREAFDWGGPELGLSAEEDPSAGWRTSPVSELAPEAARVLQAFTPRVEREPSGDPELRAFTTGRPRAQAPSLESAILLQPIPLTVQAPVASQSPGVVAALEEGFFALPPESDEAPKVPVTVAEAVLGPTPAVVVPKPDDGRGVAVVAIAALALLAAVLTGWKLWGGAPEALPVPEIAAKVVQVMPAPPPAPVVEAVAETRLSPEESKARLLDATKLYEANKLTEARQALEALVEADPSSAQAWLLLGLARFDTSDVPGAEEAAQTTLALDPQAARAHVLQASIELFRGQKEAARASLDKYLAMEPNGAHAAEAKALLKR